MTCSLTLKGAHDQAQQVLLEWQSRKAARVSTFEAHQVCRANFSGKTMNAESREKICRASCSAAGVAEPRGSARVHL